LVKIPTEQQSTSARVQGLLLPSADVRRFVIKMGDHVVLLNPGHYRIGRDPGCEVRIDDESVSRRHASLRVSATGVELTDHGSRNGVRVNGERVYGSIELRPGDEVDVGGRKLRLEEQGMPDSIEAVTKPIPKLARETPTGTTLDVLSPREREVFSRLARGQTQREIAEELGLSVKTVETYRARIGDKLGVKTRAELVQYALDAGILRSS
jgi:DNA-binding CsgD family transcriptional regulator